MFERHGTGNETRLYRIWRAMRFRCTNPTHESFAYYGGRGIAVCEEWDKSFPDFRRWALATGYTDALSIDRIDNDQGYSPSNCRWATAPEQNKNRRPSGVLVTHNGKTQNLREWASELGIYYTTLNRRYHKGLRGVHLFAAVDRTKSHKLT